MVSSSSVAPAQDCVCGAADAAAQRNREIRDLERKAESLKLEVDNLRQTLREKREDANRYFHGGDDDLTRQLQEAEEKHDEVRRAVSSAELEARDLARLQSELDEERRSVSTRIEERSREKLAQADKLERLRTVVGQRKSDVEEVESDRKIAAELRERADEISRTVQAAQEAIKDGYGKLAEDELLQQHLEDEIARYRSQIDAKQRILDGRSQEIPRRREEVRALDQKRSHLEMNRRIFEQLCDTNRKERPKLERAEKELEHEERVLAESDTGGAAAFSEQRRDGEAKLSELQRDFDSKEIEIRDREVRLADKRESIGDLRDRISATDRERREWEARRDGLCRDFRDAEVAVQHHDHDIGSIREQLDSMRRGVASNAVANKTASKLEGLKKDNSSAAQALSAKRQELQEIQNDLARREDEVAQRERAMRSHQPEIEKYKHWAKFLREREDEVKPALDELARHAQQKQHHQETRVRDLDVRDRMAQEKEQQVEVLRRELAQKKKHRARHFR